MPLKVSQKTIKKLIEELSDKANKVEKINVSQFGYRERIQIERILFLIFKGICKATLNYELQGLSQKHYSIFKDNAKLNSWSKEIKKIAEAIFELHVYLQRITSSNAYVRNDALLIMVDNLKDLMPILSKKIQKIVLKAEHLV